MSIWRDEADFMKDIESISEFYISGNHNTPSKKFGFNSKKPNKPVLPAWYDQSDSEEETDNYAFGRGRRAGDKTRDPGPADHHEVMRDIRMQVRNVVGNKYNNDVIETYYNVCKNEHDDTKSQAPKEVSINYAKEQRSKLKNATIEPLSVLLKKPSIADNIQPASVKDKEQKSKSPVVSTSSSCSSSPRRAQKHENHSKRRYAPRSYRTSLVQNQPVSTFPFSQTKKVMNVNSKEEFPPL